MKEKMKDTEYWIDTDSGTWGDIATLRIVDDAPPTGDHLADSEISKYGQTYGYSVEDVRTSAYEQGEESGQQYENPVITEAMEAGEALAEAIQTLLTGLDIEGTCQLCEMPYYFHAANCLIHDVNNALDRMEMA